MGCLTTAAIGLHLLSWHSYSEFNNINPGVYVRTECGIQVGAFYNSERNLSVYTTYTLESKHHPFFAFVGGSTGYQYAPVVPLIGAGVKLWDFRIAYIPGFEKYNTPHVLHLTFEF